MSKNLYLVIVNGVAHYYVYCDYHAVMNERTTLLETGCADKVVFVQLKLSDFDEINHNHFC